MGLANLIRAEFARQRKAQHMLKLVYVAGPYTTPDPIVNTRNAILEGQRVYEAGMFPYVPHLTLLWHMVAPQEDVEYWYAFDLNAIDHADVLLRMEGRSTGADREVEYAESVGVPVVYSFGELLAWFDAQPK